MGHLRNHPNQTELIKGLRIDRYDLNRPLGWVPLRFRRKTRPKRLRNIYFEGLDVAPLRIAGKLESQDSFSEAGGSFELAVSTTVVRRPGAWWKVLWASCAVPRMRKEHWFVLRQVKPSS